MRHMILAAAFAAFAAAPAAGQIAGSHDYGPTPRIDRLGRGDSRLPAPSIGRDLREVRGRIDDARDSDGISRREARAFRREARLIGALANRYARDGLSPWEARELEFRTQALRSRVSAPGVKSVQENRR